MASLNKYVDEYKRQIKKGDIKKAYVGLMGYLMDLRILLKNSYPEHSISGLYQGYMDMSYFTFTPQTLKSRKLKVALVFVHDDARFEVWLAGFNKQIQKEYWVWLKECDIGVYQLPETIKGRDSIVEHSLVDNPDFDDPEALTTRIEEGLLSFIVGIEQILARCTDG